MSAKDNSKESAESEIQKGAPRPMPYPMFRVFLFLALIVNTVCLFQRERPETEPPSEAPEKLAQQAELESLLRGGSKSEIQEAATSQAKAYLKQETCGLRSREMRSSKSF